MLVSWAGTRGAISLAAALALPLTVQGGAAFPQRDLLLFLTFVVIGATLVGPGFTLPTVVRRLRVPTGDGEDERRREAEARYAAATAALQRLDTLMAVEPARSEVAEQLRRRAENRQLAAREELDADDGPNDRGAESHSETYRRIAREMMAAEREELVRLRNDGRLDDEAFRRVQRELDLEEAPLLPDR